MNEIYEVEKKFVFSHGEGHWEVSYRGKTATCDKNELKETIEELLKDMEETA